MGDVLVQVKNEESAYLIPHVYARCLPGASKVTSPNASRYVNGLSTCFHVSAVDGKMLQLKYL